MLCPVRNSILFTPSSVPTRHVSGFLKTFAQYTAVAYVRGTHPQSLNFNSGLARTDTEFLTSDDRVMIRNVPWPTLQLTRRYRNRSLRITEKTIHCLTSLFNRLTPAKGLVCNPFLDTLSTAIAAPAKSRFCTSIERDPTCFHTALVRVTKLTRSTKTLVTGKGNENSIDLVEMVKTVLTEIILCKKLGMTIFTVLTMKRSCKALSAEVTGKNITLK